MSQIKRLPAEMTLAPTLAQRIRQLREFRGLSVDDLARVCRLEKGRVEDLEGGLETWLSTSDRQILAKALVVEPYTLQEVEVRHPANEDISAAAVQQLIISILAGNRDLECPVCGYTLHCSIQNALDIEGRPIQFAKAFCKRCPYVLKS